MLTSEDVLGLARVETLFLKRNRRLCIGILYRKIFKRAVITKHVHTHLFTTWYSIKYGEVKNPSLKLHGMGFELFLKSSISAYLRGE